MSGFEENNCRLCNKTFCCPKCRLKHEIKIHHILPECNLCIFGYSVFDDIVKEDQFEHLKNVHFPLNCVYCRRIFTSVAEIRQHQKCSILHQSNDSPKTPFRQDNPLEIDEEAQDSPILQELQRKESLNYIFNLATSTPMQRIQEPVRFNKNQVPDTPIIINIEKNSQTINKSIIKKIDSRVDSMKGDNSSKRRVTFGETSEKSEKNKSIASENIGNKTSTPEYSQEKVSKSPVTPASRNKSDQFYSAKSHISSAKTNDFLRQTPSSQGFTPLGVPHTSKLKTVKGNIYASSDLLPPNVDEKDCNLLTTSNNENLILNAVSMNLCAAEEIHSNLETYADNDDLNLIDLSSTSMECFPPNSLNIGQSATDAGDSKKVDQLKLIDNFFTPGVRMTRIRVETLAFD